MTAIFISYRRSDSEYFAAHLRDALDDAIGEGGNVFLDVDEIKPGEDWRSRLDHALTSCQLVVVIIGPAWLRELNKRAEDDDDPVRWEIESALNSGVAVLPLLLGATAMPSDDDLPTSLASLTSKQAIRLATTRSADHQAVVQQIVEAFDRGVARGSAGVYAKYLDPTLDLLEWYRECDNILTVQGPETDNVVRLPAAVVLDSSDVTDEEDVLITLSDEPFHAHTVSAAAFDEFRKAAKSSGKSFYNSQTARLQDVTSSGPITLGFQPATYFDYVRTNMAMDFDDPLHGSLRAELHADHRLEPLAESSLANHLGINGLVFTSDATMIVQCRGSKVLTNPGQACPGFSGAVTEDDVERAMVGRQHVGRLSDVHVYRELTEELGVRPRTIRSRRFMGLSRELLRGGKPEIFYSLDLDLTAADVLSSTPKEREGTVFAVPLRAASSELTPREARNYRRGFTELVGLIESTTQSEASMPLLTNLAFWVNQHG